MHIVFAFLIAFSVSGCRFGNRAPVANVSVEDAAARFAAKTALPVDVNSEDTRSRYGLIADAILLPDSEAFALSILPADTSKQLIFYCGGPGCPSSHVAAKVARAGGYGNVFIMKEGIAGWVSAGKAVVKR